MATHATFAMVIGCCLCAAAIPACDSEGLAEPIELVETPDSSPRPTSEDPQPEPEPEPEPDTLPPPAPEPEPGPSPDPAPTPTPGPTTGQGYRAHDGRLWDAEGKEIRLFGVNWFGFETPNYVVHGIWSRGYKDMITQIRSLGFNAVRLPVCPTTLRGVAVSSIDFARNPDLQGGTSLDALDAVIAELDKQQLYVLLDHHRTDCNSISELWYTSSYSETDWIDDLVFLAERYVGVRAIVGIDLKNEPHGAATWGSGDPATDWDKAATRAARAVLAANPEVLVFVEGIERAGPCSGNINHWWGGNLEPIMCAPLDIPADKLVLSPHVYGPDVFQQPYFQTNDFPGNMPPIWEEHFGRLVDEGYTVVIGEFGGRYGHGGDARDVAWQNSMVDYMVDKGLRSFFYWSWNPNSGDTGGILQDDWQTPWQDKVTLLQRLMAAP